MEDSEGKDKKAQTIEKRQNALKKRFIEKIQKNPIIENVSAKTGINRSTYYRWIENDPKFRKEVQEALQRGIDLVNDMMESLLIKNAKNDKLGAITFWLKNRHDSYKKQHMDLEHHIAEEDVLTDERKAQISAAIEAWSYVDPDADERDEDYEICDEDEKKEEPPKAPKKPKKKKGPTVPKKAVPIKASQEIRPEKPPRPKNVSGVAKKIVPKKLSE